MFTTLITLPLIWLAKPVEGVDNSNVSIEANQFLLHTWMLLSWKQTTERTRYVTCSLNNYSSFIISESSTKLSYLHTEGGKENFSNHFKVYFKLADSKISNAYNFQQILN